MGNYQEYCGRCNCVESNFKFGEEVFPDRPKTMSDYQEGVLVKGLKAWKGLHHNNHFPFSTKHLPNKIKKLDEFIIEKVGIFVEIKLFENSINKEVLDLSLKLAKKECQKGFKSFEENEKNENESLPENYKAVANFLRRNMKGKTNLNKTTTARLEYSAKVEGLGGNVKECLAYAVRRGACVIIRRHCFC